MLSKAVRAKSLTARFNLGMAYLSGDGVPRDSMKAVQWLKVAENQNFSEAQYTLGVLFIEGQEGIEKNTIEGLRYLNKAAEQQHQLAREYIRKRQGDEKTSGSLGTVVRSNVSSDKDLLTRAKSLYTGIGTEKDYERSYKLFLPLAEGGNAEAARYVGLMKFSGKGTNKSIDDARQWLSVAAQKGDRVAQNLLDKYKAIF